MKDKENPNIEYKQISIPLVLVTILFIALVIMGVCFASLYLGTSINAIIKGEGNITRIIVLAVVDVYLIYSMVANIIVARNAMKMTIDQHPILSQALLYTSLNIPSGVIYSVILNRQKA